MIQSLRQDGCKLYAKDTNGDWYEFADLSQCSPDIIIPGENGNQKRCNTASYFADQYFQGVFNESILKWQDSNGDVAEFIDFVATAAVGIIGAVVVVGTAGASLPVWASVFVATGTLTTVASTGAPSVADVITDKLANADVSLAEIEASDGFWPEVKRRLYCVMPTHGKIDRTVLELFAQEVEQIPNKLEAGKILGTMIRTLDVNTANKIAQYANTINTGVLAECQVGANCDNPCDLSTNTSGASVTLKNGTSNTWIIESPATGDFQVTVSTPFTTHTCQIQSVNLTSGSLENNSGLPIGNVYIAETNRGSLLNTYEDLEGKCFTNIFLTSELAFQVEITLVDCGAELPLPASGCALHTGDGIPEILLESGTYGAYDNVYLLFDGQYPNLGPDDWHEYYLSDSNACCSLIQLPISSSGEVPPPDPPEYGILPTETEYKDCNTGQWIDLTTGLPKEGETPLEFNAIRFKGNYAIQVALVPAFFDWPYVSDFAESPNGWNAGELDGNPTADYISDNWRYTDINYNDIYYGRFLSISVDFANPVTITEVTLNYDFYAGGYGTPNAVIRAYYQGAIVSEHRRDTVNGTDLVMQMTPNTLVDRIYLWFRSTVGAPSSVEGYAGVININGITISGDGSFPTELT